MPFQRVLRRFKSSPAIQTLMPPPPKPADTPTFPRRIPSIPLSLKHNDPMITDTRYVKEINDLINLVDVMLADSLNSSFVLPMPAIRTASNESSLPKIASATSETRAFDALTYPKFKKFFTIANNWLYALLEDNEELHRLVHTIKLVNQSNHRREEVRIRQEQFAYSQFQLALDKLITWCTHVFLIGFTASWHMHIFLFLSFLFPF